MKVSGKVVQGGLAMGPIYVLKSENYEIKKQIVLDTVQEIQRYELARKGALEELQALYEKTLEEIGEDGASIMEVHQMMIEDDDFHTAIIEKISQQKFSSDYAIFKMGEEFADNFQAMDNEYMKERAARSEERRVGKEC